MTFDSDGPAVAESIKAMGTTSSGGLPEFLGLRTTDVGPGTRFAELIVLAPVREGTLSAGSKVISMSRRAAVACIDAPNEDHLVGAAQGTVTVAERRRRT